MSATAVAQTPEEDPRPSLDLPVEFDWAQADQLPDWAAKPVAPPVTLDELAERAREFPEIELDLMGKVYGLSRAEVIARMEVEEASIGIDHRLGLRWPTTYAGAWLDETGQPILHVAFAGEERLDEVEAEVREAFLLSDRVAIEEVRYSLAELRQARDRIMGDLIAESRSASYGAGIDLVGNQVTVEVSADFEDARIDELAAEWNRDFGADRFVLTRDYVMADIACLNENDCRWNMIGGIRLIHGGDICTSGFAMGAQVLPGVFDYYMSSAAHCGAFTNNDNGWRRNGNATSHYGRVAADQYGGKYDVEIIDDQHSNPWDTRADFISDFPTERTVTGYIGEFSYTTNVWAGAHGPWSTATHRGPIKDVDFETTIGGVAFDQLIKVDTCAGSGTKAQGGDSGGAYFRNNTAYGIAKSVSGTGGGCPGTTLFGKAATLNDLLFLTFILIG